MALRLICVAILVRIVSAQEYNRNEGFINTLNSGMKFAKDFLGSESIALNVAEFIVKAFQPKPSATSDRRRPNDDYSDGQENKPYPEISETQNPMSGLKQLVRLFGLQPNQISAVAVNALVFVAQMITTFLAGPKRPTTRPYRFEDTKSWILNKNSRALQDLLATAKNDSLSEMIENRIKEQAGSEDTSCIQLLVCKITPFVNKMQRTVFGNDSEPNLDENGREIRGAAVMYRHLPTKQEITARSDICEQKHKECDLNQ